MDVNTYERTKWRERKYMKHEIMAEQEEQRGRGKGNSRLSRAEYALQRCRIRRSKFEETHETVNRKGDIKTFNVIE